MTHFNKKIQELTANFRSSTSSITLFKKFAKFPRNSFDGDV